MSLWTILGKQYYVNVVYYKEIKRELNRRLIYEYRCDERLTVTAGGSVVCLLVRQ
jgi:hypothetical protein